LIAPGTCSAGTAACGDRLFPPVFDGVQASHTPKIGRIGDGTSGFFGRNGITATGGTVVSASVDGRPVLDRRRLLELRPAEG
jgi:hypothetical protein